MKAAGRGDRRGRGHCFLHHLACAALTLFGGFAAPGIARAELTAAERRITESVDQGTPQALQLLQRLVDVNSGTMNFDGVREVGRMLRTELDALGFSTRWVDGAPFRRAGHLVATRAAKDAKKRGPRVLLIGHLDTVFERDSPFQKFQPLSDSTAAGPGVCDMKGGDVVILLAMRALKDAGLLDRMAITIVFSGDEEKMGSPLDLARKDLLDAAEWADVALGFEDGPGDPRLAVIARRGATSWRLRVSGTTSHSSQIFRPNVGHGAIFEAARILHAFEDSLSHESNLTFNPGLIVGGTDVTFDGEQSRGTAFGKGNVVAESTTVSGDLRTLTAEQLERATVTMRRIVAAHGPRENAEITFDEGYPPLAPTDGNRHLLSLFDAASRDLGFGPVEGSDPARAGAADVSFTAGKVEMAMDGLGLMGSGGHTVQEVGNLRTLPMNAKRVGVTLARLTSQWKPKR
jgi:glutamate carboxypeptidase